MKKFFSILLAIVFAAALFVTLPLGVVRFNFSYSTITSAVSQMLKPVSKARLQKNESGLYYPGKNVAVLTQLSYDFSSIDMSSLDEAGVDVEPEVVAEILASPDVADFIDKYADKVVDYMTGATDTLDIDTADIKALMNKSLDIYEKKTGVAVDRSGMDQTIESSVQAALPEITASLDAAKAENAQALESLKWVKILLSLKTFLLCVAACVLLAVFILLINMNVFAMFKYISIPAIIDGILLLAAAAVCARFLPEAFSMAAQELKLPGGIFEAVWLYAAKLFLKMEIYGAVAAVCGVILCVLGFALDKKAAKNESSQSLAS